MSQATEVALTTPNLQFFDNLIGLPENYLSYKINHHYRNNDDLTEKDGKCFIHKHYLDYKITGENIMKIITCPYCYQKIRSPDTLEKIIQEGGKRYITCPNCGLTSEYIQNQIKPIKSETKLLSLHRSAQITATHY